MSSTHSWGRLGIACVSNVKCISNPAMKRAYLCALRGIGVGEELLLDYGPGFELSEDEGDVVVDEETEEGIVS